MCAVLCGAMLCCAAAVWNRTRQSDRCEVITTRLPSLAIQDIRAALMEFRLLQSFSCENIFIIINNLSSI